jgi:hypothetical protein
MAEHVITTIYVLGEHPDVPCNKIIWVPLRSAPPAVIKILDTSKDPNIRSNIVIMLGDVAVSFSNIIGENSKACTKASDGQEENAY